ncbi:ParB/RepB/Spo0J family partition protein [Dasania marina]|uniref:ParB/RepB/Spo0J family partition protein n=1 Tax=Dasania marina TaxID=471499 RepID=UPI0030D81F54|tara:strand:- start:12072 stop:13109 length:1038 start_codon:yes stop_codon:yes gene_type:complete
MSKVDVKSFRKNRSEKSDAPMTEQQVAASEREKYTASPALGGRGKGRVSAKTERKILHLPVTKKDIELTAMYVSPADCLIHPRNRRNQSLLRESNPDVMDLKKSIMEEGQRDPVLARHITVDGEQRVEIIDGSRRRFVSELIAKDNPDYKLKIWFGREIPDTDADYLTKVENELQKRVSAWETAQYLKRLTEENPGITYQIIAYNEKMSLGSVSAHLALSRVPYEVVALLSSPDLLAIQSSLPLMKILDSLDPKAYSALLSDLQGMVLFTSTSDLLNEVKALIGKNNAIQTPAANKKIEIKYGKKLRAVVGKNRTKKGQYKLDLYDLSDDEYTKVIESITKILTQ